MANALEFEKKLTIAHRDDLLPRVFNIANDMCIYFDNKKDYKIEYFQAIKNSQYFVKFNRQNFQAKNCSPKLLKTNPKLLNWLTNGSISEYEAKMP